VLIRWQDASRVSNGYPADRHGRSRLKFGSQMYGRVYAHFCTFAQVGSMKDSRSGSNEYLVLQSSAHNMRVGANQAMIADRAGMTAAAPDHCVLHDDAVCTDADPSPTLTDEAGSVQNAGPWSDVHIAATVASGATQADSAIFGCLPACAINMIVFLLFRNRLLGESH
jgi:hypothetical protein